MVKEAVIEQDVTAEAEEQLTPRQREVLDALRRFIARRRYAPSVREIRDQFGWASTSTVNYHLDILQDKGLIARDRFIARSIRLL
jgi:repressor LexA